jgi:serine/threonine protein kinase
MERLLFGGGGNLSGGGESVDSPTSPSLALGIVNTVAAEELVIGSVIGKGTFGTVTRGSYRGGEVAVKSLTVRDLVANSLLKYLHTELEVLSALHHPHLLKYHGCAQRGNTFMIVTEFLTGGPLSDLIALDTTTLPWNLRVHLARGVAEGLSHLHSADLLHRDIKTENILLDDSDWKAVICDYGFSKKVLDLKGGARQPGTILGTERFMAPEIQFGKDYGESADIFSLGVILAELACGREVGVGGFLERTPRNKFNFDVECFRASTLPECPPSFIECAAQCLGYEPESRPNAEVVCAWLTDLLKDLPPLDLTAFPPPSKLRALIVKSKIEGE